MEVSDTHLKGVKPSAWRSKVSSIALAGGLTLAGYALFGLGIFILWEVRRRYGEFTLSAVLWLGTSAVVLGLLKDSIRDSFKLRRERRKQRRAAAAAADQDRYDRWQWDHTQSQGRSHTMMKKVKPTDPETPVFEIETLPTTMSKTPIVSYEARRRVTAEDFAALVRKGEVAPLLDAIANERLRDLDHGARPRPRTWTETILGRRRDAIGRSLDVLEHMTETTEAARALVSSGNDLRSEIIRAGTAQQQYELEAEKLRAEIAQQQAARAEHEAAAAKAQPNNPPDQNQRRRDEELAEKNHQRKLMKQAQKQAYWQYRIEGLKDPDTARRRKAEREAEREARPTEHKTRVLSELERKARKQIAKAKKLYGENSDAVEHIINHWSALIERHGGKLS